MEANKKAKQKTQEATNYRERPFSLTKIAILYTLILMHASPLRFLIYLITISIFIRSFVSRIKTTLQIECVLGEACERMGKSVRIVCVYKWDCVRAYVCVCWSVYYVL